jgi:protein-L-isoaspartate(D-aspartate) O-methyltransferase
MRHRLQPSDRKAMVELQLRARGVADERVLEAMARVPRELFVPDAVRANAYDDAALPIGSDQTISQPYMVARICAELALSGHEKVLDVGTGSGYQAAVLAELACEVHSIERIPELAAAARVALAEAGYAHRVRVVEGDGSLGLPGEAPFNAIAVAAAAQAPPPALLEQLERGGRLAIPIGPPEQQFLRIFIATPEGAADYAAVPCRFVPLVGER